jgi:hypothetical protein
MAHHPTREEIQEVHLSLMQRAGAVLVAIACLGTALVLIMGE